MLIQPMPMQQQVPRQQQVPTQQATPPTPPTPLQNAISRAAQCFLSGGAIGNLTVQGNGNGGVVIQPERNAFGNFLHSGATNPLLFPPGAILNRLTR